MKTEFGDSKMGYIDLHCDTVSRIMQSDCATLKDNDFMINYTGMKHAGTDVQFFACFLYALYFDDYLSEEDKKKDYCLLDINSDAWDKAYEYALYMSDKLDYLMDDDIKPAVSFKDIINNKENGGISAVKTIEEGGIINGCLSRINDLGIIIDVSHLSDGGFDDCIRYSRYPICASHSDARALCGHPRNLTDKMLRTLGEHGGVAGLNFCPEFLRDDGLVSVDDQVKHILYMINKGGEDVVALGSDFDGITNPYMDNWTNTVNDMPLLFDALKKAGLKERQMDKLMFGNAMRLIKDNWK